MIPCEDKLMLLPRSTCVRGGGGFLIPCEDKLTVLPQPTYLSKGGGL